MMPAAVSQPDAPKAVQVNINVTKAVKAVRGSISERGVRDTSLLLKTVMAEAFGSVLVKPWRLHTINSGVATVLGYTSHDLEHQLSFTRPEIHQAVQVFSMPVPPLRKDLRLRFHVRFVPTLRNRNYGERDAYSVALTKDLGARRDAVYSDYLVKRLHGAQVQRLRIDGFRSERFIRPVHAANRTWVPFQCPVVDISGELTVQDPDSFMTVLLKGIGHQRAYGYGYIRLESL